MIATQSSIMSAVCPKAPATVRGSRVARPAMQARVVPAAKGLSSLGLGAQERTLFHSKANQVVSTSTRRVTFRVQAAAAAASSEPNMLESLALGIIGSLLGAIRAVAAVAFYAATTAISLPLMCVFAVWAPFAMIFDAVNNTVMRKGMTSVKSVWETLVSLFWAPIAAPVSTAADVAPVTEADVLSCQKNWAAAIKGCSKIYLDGGDYVGAAAEAAGQLYGYGHSNVLFKPTKATDHPFRPKAEEAMSYFVGCDAVDNGYPEDAGFAINGGKGWSNVVFTNHQIEYNGDTAIAMGSYDFTCATTGAIATVEYTFGYKRNEDGNCRIFLHHSSVPYVAHPAPLTEAEVLECQANWAAAIKGCSKLCLEGGDYVGAAAEAAGQLYGYGHTDVLFKPTKATDNPFRPTGAEAMSYFVGCDAVEDGYPEDAGFAINGGKGWADVVFTNHNITYNGDSAIAMGSYDFTCATTGTVATVEYTFGYKRNEDGKPRIFLHHSSVPYVAMPAPLTEAEVLECQANWAAAIKGCSKICLEGGDYVGAAAEAAGQLYGYGHSNVLFKPTKAAEFPFRPTAEEAMSYFVGGDAVDGGYKEDAGFAINGGKGWSDVVFTNHQIEYNYDTAIAMGSYVFTCASTGNKSKVEYTFGYKRNEDGKPRIFLHHSSVPYALPAAPAAEGADAPVTEAEVLECQKNWAAAIKGCSKIYAEGGDYVGAAAEAAGQLYGYGHSNVLFKPTKAAEYPFRPTGGEAMSYFVGGEVVEDGYAEDAGFAINGGKGWSDVVFTNHQVDLNGKTAIAMGSYVFTDATSGAESKVEYTFGYKRNDDGKVRIFLHHSSVPYAAAVAPVTEAEVLECQKNWANAITGCSKICLEGGDYVAAAAEAAGQLYGYGHSNVLFKPTKAAEYPFRPTGEEAMSYFVGCDAVDGGYKEDAGFAINGGKGWAKVVFHNHQIEYNGDSAVAMGYYMFTCATTGEENRVEYTFGYKRNDDGKCRIFLHHSSVPYVAAPVKVMA